MKKTFHPVGILILMVLTNCSPNEETSNPELSDFAKDYLSMRYGNQRMESLDALNNPINQSFQGMMNNFGPMNGRVGGDSTAVEDTTLYEDPWEPWITCATVTETTNDDGSTTQIVDYGDGCYEGWDNFKYWMHGKTIQTHKNNYFEEDGSYSDDYLFNVKYEDYGGTYYGDYYQNGEMSWSIDGFSNFEGSSQYDQNNQTFSGSYSHSSETTYQWDSSAYYYKSNGTSTYNQNKSVAEGEYEYRSTYNDYFYGVKILEPLVLDFSCNHNDGREMIMSSICFITYVSGREYIQYRQDGEEGSFIIDYGDGECDNIITIIENGVEKEVDLSNIYSDQPVLLTD